MADPSLRGVGVGEKRPRVAVEKAEVVCACCGGPLLEKRTKWESEVDGLAPQMSQDLWKNLPEELLEKVFARLPVRSLFTMRTLSRRWRTKLKDFLPFQAEVKSVTGAWKSHGPIDVDKSGMKGFDAATSKWETLFKPWNIPNNPLLREDGSEWKVASVCGYLICFMRPPPASEMKIWQELEMEVSNPMNGSWRRLPRLETKLWSHFTLVVRVVPAGDENYMIVVIGDLQPFYVYIYSSFTYRWTEHHRDPYPFLRCKSIQYFDKRVYFLYERAEPYPDDDSEGKESLGVEMFHVELGIWERRPLPFKEYEKYDLLGFLVCQSSLMMIGVEKHFTLVDEDFYGERGVPADMPMQLFGDDSSPDSSPEVRNLEVDEELGAFCPSDLSFVECRETLHLLKVTDAWTLEEILSGPPDGFEDVLCFLGDFYNDDDRIVMTTWFLSQTRLSVNSRYSSPSVLICDLKKKTWETKQLSCDLTEPYFNSQCTFKVGLNPFIVA
ncbi:hypothetical protein R1flu_018747 [Riccia fluitans]|uniref:F-box domain-containing protein n=1 Tax=Riccia fluitans TaxID=41844 RepID=A0ABD1ZK77_9MARC